MIRRRRSLPIELKKEVIKKCGTKCFYCGEKGFIHPSRPDVVVKKEPSKKWINIYDGTFYFRHEAFHFDHVIPFSKGGRDSLENLVIACPKCNLEKYDK